MSETKSIIERVTAMLVRKAVNKSAAHMKKRTLQMETLEVREMLTAVGFHSVVDATEGAESGYFRLERDNTQGTLTVNYQLDSKNNGCIYSANCDGWARNGLDFKCLPGTACYCNYGSVTFADGCGYVDVNIETINDQYIEGPEKVALTLRTSSNYSLSGESTATLTLTDDDYPVTVSIDSTKNATEGGEHGYFRLKRDDTTNALTVYYNLDYRNTGCSNSAGYANNGVDFQCLPGSNCYYCTGSITFVAGQEYVDIPIKAIDDQYVEGNETVSITLCQYNACGCCGANGVSYLLDDSAKSATVSIIDNEEPVKVWIESTAHATEGGENGYYRLRRDYTTNALTVYYNLDSRNTGCSCCTGYAKNGVDFQCLPGTSC